MKAHVPTWLWWMLLAGFVLALGGCRAASPVSTAAAPGETPIASTAPAQPAATPTPTVTPTASATPVPTPTATLAPPCLWGRVREATLQSSPPPLLAGVTVTFAWTVENTGACPWETPLELEPLGEPPPQWEARFNGGPQVEPGEQLEVAVALPVPPATEPRFFAWTLRTSTGEAIPLSPAPLTLALPPVITPTPTVFIPILVQRQVTLTHGQNLNFDDGMADIIYYAFGPGNQSLVHIGRKMRVAPVYQWPPDYYTCRNLNYGERNAIDQPQYQVGSTFCFLTNEGRYGGLRIDSVYSVGDRWYIVLTYFTWDLQP